MRVAEDPEMPLAHGVQHHGGHLLGTAPAARHGLAAQGVADALACGGARHRLGGAVAVAVGDAGRHVVGTEHRTAHLFGDQREVVVQGLAEAHHRVLADVVGTREWRIEDPGHAGGVDDMALPAWVGLGGRQHHGREESHAVHHAAQVDAQHPVPVGLAGLPDEPPEGHPGVVENQVRCAEARLGGRRQGRHLGAAAHIHPLRQVRRGAQLLADTRQRVGLHVGQHQVHALERAQSRQRQSEAAACAGDERRLALEVHVQAFLSIRRCGMPSSSNTSPTAAKP